MGYIDMEWERAEKTNEDPQYYWVETCHRYPLNNGRFIKYYKPSVAALVAKRTGYKIYAVEKTQTR